jgi:hypothetical protein
MTDDRLAKIEKRLTEQLARSDADSAVLQIVICRLASDRRDWRDYLETLRITAEASFRNTSYCHCGEFEAARHQLLGRQHIEETFSVIRNALLAAEKPLKEPQSPPQP